MVIGICDDFPLWREQARGCIEQLKVGLYEEVKCVEFESGKEVLAYKGPIDILLLDIEMPEMNGIETMEILEDYDNVKDILFITGHDSYVYKAFGTKTRGFLCKPLKQEELSDEIKRIINRRKRKERRIELETTEGVISQVADDILYVNGAENYVWLVTKYRRYMMYGSIKYWQEVLEKYDIIRVHKSYLVNLENVYSIKKDVEMNDKEVRIPLGRKYRDISREKYQDYTFKKFREGYY